jgi:glycogen debranching enzyme
MLPVKFASGENQTSVSVAKRSSRSATWTVGPRCGLRMKPQTIPVSGANPDRPQLQTSRRRLVQPPGPGDLQALQAAARACPWHCLSPSHPNNTSVITKEGVGFYYEGLDELKRKTELRFCPRPSRVETNRATFEFELASHERKSLFVSVLCEDRNKPRCDSFGHAFRARRRAIRHKATGIATIESSNELFNEVCQRATADLYMLMTRTRHGLYPYAGIPWYSTAFGRDGIITAMLLLWLDPSVAKGVLGVLAETQAKTLDPLSDAQPGKILHETRKGEMARLGEVPFRLYYGTVDATPLFVMLAGMYFDRTGDIATIAAIWPNIKAALHWIDTFGDSDLHGSAERPTVGKGHVGSSQANLHNSQTRQIGKPSSSRIRGFNGVDPGEVAHSGKIGVGKKLSLPWTGRISTRTIRRRWP